MIRSILHRRATLHPLYLNWELVGHPVACKADVRSATYFSGRVKAHIASSRSPKTVQLLHNKDKGIAGTQ